MKRFLLGGFAAAGLLLGGLAITGGAALASDENFVSTWCETGVKYDDLSGQTFTIPELPDDAPEGAVWTKLVLNGGQDGAPAGNVRSYVVTPVPAVGTVITRPGAAVSNAILCYEVPEPPTTESTVPTTESTVPTTESSVPTTESSVPTTESSVPTTESTVPTTESTVPTTESTVPTTESTPAPPEAAPPTEVAAAGPVPPAAAPAAAPPAPAQSALPSTGSSSWGFALTALASLLGGLGLVKLSRRTS